MEDDDNPMPDTMSDPEKVAATVRLLTLDKQTDNHFLGHRKPGGVGRIYGGQVVAQALRVEATQRRVAGGDDSPIR